MKALVISLCSELLSEMEFVTPLVRIARHSGYLVQLGRVGEVTHARGFDAVLLSGTALQDFGYLDQMGTLSWLRDFPGKVLGVCAGMQVLALLHGAELFDCEEIGMTEIHSESASPLPERFEVYALHRKAVRGGKLEVLGSSARCAQVVKVPGMEHFGMLFHPEVRNPELVSALLGRLK
ncbi:glutamine amidotransferase [Candidatus Woesearchaeota archaeon]|nr:glutamine amidotransferase [Candidatus Woesearchaeota archaeon]